MHVNALFDLLEKRFTDVVIQPRKQMKEVDAACSMVDANDTRGKCLYLFDRGYESLNLMAHVCERRSFFIIRAKDVSSQVSPFRVLDLPEKEEFDSQIRFICTRNIKLKKEDTVLYKHIQKSTRFDYISPDDMDGSYELRFRLIKLKLESGIPEYLITNLPQKMFPPSEIKKLYNLRWGIEVSFLLLKYRSTLCFFHSIKREYLVQEIFAKLIMYNLVSLILSCQEIPYSDTLYHYKISFSDAVYKCRLFLVKLKAYDDISSLLLQNLTPIRPGRSFVRNMKSQRLRTLQHRP
jgi:hypothetical protein